jgi:hypothetical protein
MNYEPEELTRIVVALLKGKYENINLKTDDEFLRDMTAV